MDTALSLVDQIYEAAVIPEQWASVCDSLAEKVDSYSASVITIDPDQSFRWISSPIIHDDMTRFSNSPLRFENVRPQRHLQRSPFSFMRDQDLMSDDELASDPIYNEFMRPLGLGWTIGDAIQEPSGHTIVFDVIRQTDKGPFSSNDVATLNSFKPDLSRAALMSSRLAFRQARSITDTLSTVGLPCAVIGDGGSVIAMNPEMEGLAPRIGTGSRNRLYLADRLANELVQTAVSQMQTGSSSILNSIPVAASDDASALVLHFVPVKRQARDVFSKSATILIATSVGGVGPPDLRVICGLFDLTAAEARVAREIAGGASIDDTAKKLTLTRETVRTYLKRIFSKTGTAKQSQLVLLLSGVRNISGR